MDYLNDERILDWQSLIWIPIIISTIIRTKKDWREIFDADFTMKDRAALMQINWFIITPIVVLLHECGHAVAMLFYGSKIIEFHYALMWGFVRQDVAFTDERDLVIKLAGSVVQVVLGMLMLVAAVFVKSPPVVTLLVYSGLTAMASTLILYTLSCFSGFIGDWTWIYTSPNLQWKLVIGTIHVMLVGLLIYLFYGFYPRLWFAGKTRPKWHKDYLAAQARIAEDPSANNYLSLAWLYYLVNLDKGAQKTLDIVKEKDPSQLEYYVLNGWLRQNKGDTEAAVENFEVIVNSAEANSYQKCRALMAIGHCLLYQVESKLPRGANPTYDQLKPVIASYEQALSAEPEVADPIYYKATLLNKVGLHKEAEFELKDLQGRKWLDPALSELYQHELQVARKSDNRQQ
ncbi:hypothetical protein KF913_10505 [Candidatus Obscuribacterales bacterium]|nr:hypothetical protein [Candidatus Obscuribacterales bacterium]